MEIERTFIIAEAGVNHNGRLDLAIELIRAAKACGADAVKFQTFNTAALVTADAPTATYQEKNSGETRQTQLLASLELSRSAFSEIRKAAQDYGIEFMSTAFDEASADFLLDLGIRRIKVPSGEITNIPFVQHLARQGLPMLVSTGMADLAEVRTVVAAIEAEQEESAKHLQGRHRICLLHCTSIYPALPHQLNLQAINTLAREFDCSVGYSDHSAGYAMAPVAVALGAEVIEKHITLDRTLPGPDHLASLEPADFGRMVSTIRDVEVAVGDGVKRPAADELETRAKVRRGIKMARSVRAGECVQAEDLVVLRPETGLPPSARAAIIGRRYRRDLARDMSLEWDDLDSKNGSQSR